MDRGSTPGRNHSTSRRFSCSLGYNSRHFGTWVLLLGTDLLQALICLRTPAESCTGTGAAGAWACSRTGYSCRVEARWAPDKSGSSSSSSSTVPVSPSSLLYTLINKLSLSHLPPRRLQAADQ